MNTHYRRREELRETSHPLVYFHMENQGRRPRHGRNDRYKDQRKGCCARIRSIRDPRFWEGS